MNLFEVWGIDPKYPYIGQAITKKQFKQQVRDSLKHVQLIDSEILKIKIAHGLNPQLININPYNDRKYIFEGIIYLTVELKSKKEIKKVAELIHQSIPQPTFLILTHGDECCLSSAIKRLNLHNNQSVMIEEIQVTKWMNLNKLSEVEHQFISSLALSELPHHDFYEFYKAIQAKLYNVNHVDEIGEYEITYSIKRQEEIQHRVELIKEKENQLNQIISKLKKETQFNKKLSLNEQAMKLKKEIDELKN